MPDNEDKGNRDAPAAGSYQHSLANALDAVSAGPRRPGGSNTPYAQGRIVGVVPKPPGYLPPPGIVLPAIDAPTPPLPKSDQPGIGTLILDGLGEAAKGIARGVTGGIYSVNPPAPIQMKNNGETAPRGGIYHR